MRHTGLDVLGAENFDYTNKMYFPTKLRMINEICGQKNVTLLYDEMADVTRTATDPTKKPKEEKLVDAEKAKQTAVLIPPSEGGS